MTPFSHPSDRPSARRTRLAVAGFVAIAVMLFLPATGFAVERDAQTEGGESSATALTSAGLLARGAGYEIPGGSKPVRVLQARLRELGHEPGPIDGLFGPKTEAAVFRFQRARRLVVDGLAGRQTTAKLVDPRVERPARMAKPPVERQPASSVEPPVTSEPGAGPEPSEGDAPVTALLGALAAALLLLAVWSATGGRARRTRLVKRAEDPVAGATPLNAGLACAVLLAVLAVGSVTGAVFATRAALEARDPAAVGRGATTIAPQSAAAIQKPRLERPRSLRREVAPRPPADPNATSRTETGEQLWVP